MRYPRSRDVLLRRYENTRRRHPLADSERVADAIAREREALDTVKSAADVVVDTSELNVHQLRDRLLELFTAEDETGLQTSVVSFGYKHGLPLDVDLVFDCRFLPNPHWVEELRPLTGRDEPVRDYVLGQRETGEFLRKDMGIPAPGDLRRCLVALADPSSPWIDAFEHRFTAGELEGHAFGNIIIAGLADATGDFDTALAEAGRLLGSVGRVIPATRE